MAEQEDPEARGFWKDEKFWLLTNLDREGLIGFFLNRVSPTPMVAPWNKGSGFYAGASGLPAIEATSAARFAAYRGAIAKVRLLLEEIAEVDSRIRALKDQTKSKARMSEAEKAEAERLKNCPEHKGRIAELEKSFKQLKGQLLETCRLRWRGRELDWMEAAVVLRPGDAPDYPAVLGSGGNDGRLDYTNNAMQRWSELLDLAEADAPARPHALPLLTQALFGVTGRAETNAYPIGQYFPGAAGGANASTGPEADSLVNPWDFVLMLEGAMTLRARATRRLDEQARSKSSAPFALFAEGIGYGSSGGEKDARGEQWLPLWSKPSTLVELGQLFGEGRMRVGSNSAARPVDALRALSRLGTARGLDSFVRYGYLERFGQSTLAVPLGRLEVRAHPSARLIDDIGDWLSRLDRARNSEHAPASLRTAVKGLMDAVFAALSHDSTPARWQAILTAAARVEEVQSRGAGFEAGPIPRFREGWIEVADDGSAEWRLALSLSRACAEPRMRGAARNEIRRHALPLNDQGGFSTTGERLLVGADVVMDGRRLVDDLLALLARRAVESRCDQGLGLRAPRGFGAHPSDLARFTTGQVDDDRILRLARAAMAINASMPDMERSPPSVRDLEPEPAWWVLRLACSSEPLLEDTRPPLDPAILRRLAAGDGAGAVVLALRRLSAFGVRPGFRGAVADPWLSRRWGATLAFPISQYTTQLLARRLDPQLAHTFQGDQP